MQEQERDLLVARAGGELAHVVARVAEDAPLAVDLAGAGARDDDALEAIAVSHGERRRVVRTDQHSTSPHAPESPER